MMRTDEISRAGADSSICSCACGALVTKLYSEPHPCFEQSWTTLAFTNNTNRRGRPLATLFSSIKRLQDSKAFGNSDAEILFDLCKDSGFENQNGSDHLSGSMP